MSKRKFSLAVVGGLLAVVLGAAAGVLPASAAKLSITLSPTKQELAMTPRQKTEGEIMIKNKGEVAYGVRVFAAPYSVDDNYENVFDKESKYTYLAGWIEFTDLDKMGEAAYWIEPGTEKVVPFVIDVPFNAPAGGQYAGIVAEVLSETDGGVAQARQVASIVYGRVDGKTEKVGEVTNRQVGFWYQGGVDTSLVVKNTGNVDFVARSALIVRGMFGNDVYVGESEEVVVFPEKERKVELKWEESRIGLFTLTQRTEMNGLIIEETKTILVMPFYVILLFIAAVVALVVLIVVLKKKHNKRKNGVRMR